MEPTPEMKVLQELSEAVNGSAKEIKSLLDAQQAEIKANGVSTEKTAKALEAAEANRQQALIDGQAMIAKLTERLDEYELKAQRGGLGFGGPASDEEKEAAKSLGEKFCEVVAENRDLFMGTLSRNTVSGLPGVSAKSFHGPSLQEKAFLQALGQKSLVTTETLNFIRPDWRPSIVPLPGRALRMRDLMPVIGTSAPSTAYLRKYGFSPATASSVTSITTATTTATVTAAAAHGFKTGDYVLIAGASVAAFNGRKQITVTSTTVFTYTIADQSNGSASGTLVMRRLNNYGAADFVAEGDAKPEAKLYYEEVIAPVQVIAHFIKASRQVLDDLGSLRNQIDGDLTYGLKRREDEALLYATGTTPQIQGLMTLSGTQSYAWSSGPVSDTKLDAIRRAMTLTQVVEAPEADAAIINPNDWEDIETTKASTGEYILAATPQPGGGDGIRIWRIPLVVSNGMQAGDAVVGNFAMACAIRDRQAANIRLADQHASDFTSNLVTILAEERMNAEWYLPNAFVVIDLDTAPSP
jgi:hypothetical protein